MTGWLGRLRVDRIECSSTNDVAAQLARDGAAHGTIVVAERQIAGRGREGRAWASPAGGLYVSAVLRPPLAVRDVPPLTLAIGIGVCDAARAAGAPAQLKWPNDVYASGKKLAGVLVEAQSQGERLESVIVGIGVNLTTTPDVVAATATSLADVGTITNRDGFLGELLAHVERWIDDYVADGLRAIVPAWRERMAPGLMLRAGAVVGELAGLDDDGALQIRDRDGAIHRIVSGDVEVLTQMQ